MIRKQGSKYCIYADQSGRRMGCYPTEKQARERNRVIEYFEHRNDIKLPKSNRRKKSR